jgi:hypothetical protein
MAACERNTTVATCRASSSAVSSPPLLSLLEGCRSCRSKSGRRTDIGSARRHPHVMKHHGSAVAACIVQLNDLPPHRADARPDVHRQTESALSRHGCQFKLHADWSGIDQGQDGCLTG